MASGESSSDSNSLRQLETPVLDANERLVEWVVDLFLTDIKKIVSAINR